MIDFKFDWEKNLETGIESIDIQHKQLFKIGRDMEQLLRTQCIGVTDKQLLDVVCELRDFTGYHFYAEESMMKEMKYPDIQRHIRFHKRCSEFITKIDMPKLKANPQKELELIRDEVATWVMIHVLSEDSKVAKEYLAYQKKQSSGKKTEEKVADQYGSFIASLDVTDLYLYKDQTCCGRIVAVFKESASELCKLSTLERNMFFGDITKVSKIVKKYFKPDAICYHDFEDMSDKLVFHIIPKYKQNGTYGVPQTPDLPMTETDADMYRQILVTLQSAFK